MLPPRNALDLSGTRHNRSQRGVRLADSARAAPVDTELPLFFRGIGVFAGYTNAGDTAAALVDGCLRTGDLSSLDGQGRLILQRKITDVFIRAVGKSVPPTIWESYVEGDLLVAWTRAPALNANRLSCV